MTSAEPDGTQVTATLPSPPRLAAETTRKLADLGLLLGGALAIRLILAAIFPSIIKPDEIYQVVEPAYHWLYGGHDIAWEWTIGMRSWVFPGLAAGLLVLGHQFGLAPPFLGVPITAFMIIASLTPIACAYYWGNLCQGRLGAVLTASIVAIWTDLVYFAPHSLNEALAAYLLLPALALTYPTRQPPDWRAMLGGILFGAALMLRIQLAPAITLALMVTLWRWHKSKGLLLIVGFLGPVFTSGGLDWLTQGVPFHSTITYFRINFLDGISSDFGVTPWYQIFLMPLLFWGPVTAPLILVLAIAGARRLPLLFAVASVIFAAHALVGHKEFRFIFPALPILMILCGIASTDLCLLSQRYAGRLVTRRVLYATALGLWAVLSLVTALSPLERYYWTRGQGDVEVMRLAASEPALCGIGLLGMAIWELPGAAGSPVGVPIYQASSDADRTTASGYNAILTGDNGTPDDPSFVRFACFPHASYYAYSPRRSICLWRRPGACVSGVSRPPAINWPPSLRPRPDGKIIADQGSGTTHLAIDAEAWASPP